MRVVGRRPLTRASIESTLGNHGLSLTLGLLLVAANVLLFIWGAHDEAAHHTDYKRWVMATARGAGYALNLDAGLALLLACRAAVGAARSSRLSAVVPLDALFPAAHAAVGLAIAAFVVIHMVFHLGWIVKDDAWAPGAWGVTWCVCSGVVLTAVLAVLMGTASRQVRRAKYHLFYRVHLACAAAFYPLLLVHGVYYGAPYTYKWIVGPMFLYALDRGYRLATQRKLSTRSTLTPLPGGVVRVTIPRSDRDVAEGEARFPYEAGAYAKVRVPDINTQWHPFTIASSPHERDLVLYVKIGAGDWTGALGEMAARDGGAPVSVAIDVKGPYGALHMTRFTHILLIAGGVGGTPFASLVKDVHHRMAAGGRTTTEAGAASPTGVDRTPFADGADSSGATAAKGDDADDAAGGDSAVDATRRARRIAHIRSTLSAQVAAALAAHPDDARVVAAPTLDGRPSPAREGAGAGAGAPHAASDGDEGAGDGGREHDAEAHFGGAVADAAAAAAAAAASDATADALVSPPRRPRAAGASSTAPDAYASPTGRSRGVWGGGGGGGSGGSGTQSRRDDGALTPWASPLGAARGTASPWGEAADAALEADEAGAATDERFAQLTHALFSPPWRVGATTWSSAGLTPAGWRDPEVVVHSPSVAGGAPSAGPAPAAGAADAADGAGRPSPLPDRDGARRASDASAAAVGGGTLRSRLTSGVSAVVAAVASPRGAAAVPASPRRPPPAVVRSPRRTLERIGVSFGRSPTASAAAASAATAVAAASTAAVSGGRNRGRPRPPPPPPPTSAATPRLCASPADGGGAVSTRGCLSPDGSSTTTSPLSATNVLDSPLGGRADVPPLPVAGADALSAAMADAIAVPPLVRRPPPKYRAMLALDTVTVNFVLLWLLLARFCVALLACIFRAMAPMDGSTPPGFVAASATALYDHRALVVADLVLALAVALPMTVAVALEAHELGLHGLLSSVGAVVDTVLLLPLAWLGVLIDGAALAGFPSGVSSAPLGDGGVILGDVGTARPWLFGVTFAVAWPALAVLLGVRLFRVLGARVLLAQSWRQSNEPTRALDFVWTAPAAAGDEWLRGEVGGLLGSPHVRMHRFVTRSGREADAAALAVEREGAAGASEGQPSPQPPPIVAAAVDAYAPTAESPALSEEVSPGGSSPATLAAAASPTSGGGGAHGDETAASKAATAAADWTTASHYGRPDWDALLATIAERATSRTVLGIFFCGPTPMAEAVRRAAARAMCESKVRGLVLAGLLSDGRLDDVDRRTLRGVTATGLDVRFVMHVESF